MHFDQRRVGVHRHDVVGQVAVDRRAVLRVVDRVLEQRHADSHHHRAFDLVAAGQWIDDAPASMTVTTRLTRSRAISGCHVTSTK